MTDRELLELAAKSLGWRWSIADLVWYDDQAGTFTKNWNPLTDDGDALRLAVRLELCVDCEEGLPAVTYKDADLWWNESPEDSRKDPCAATRRAIVRAAAEIGKTLP